MADNDPFADVAIEDIEITVDSLSSEGPRFLGEIVVEAFVNGLYGKQYQLSVRQLDVMPDPGKNDKVHTGWTPIKKQRRSAMGMQILSLNQFTRPDLEGDEKVWPVGRNRCVGMRGWFVRRDIVFGRNKTSGEEISTKGTIIAVAPFNPITDEDLILNPCAGTPYVYERSEPNADGGGVRSREVDLTPELAAAVATWLDGKDEDGASTAAVREKKDFPFDDDVKRGIISGVMLRQLVASGNLTKDDSGVYHAE